MTDFIEEKELRILILEDALSDAELEEKELRDAGLSFTSLRVDTRAAFERALDEFKPDIVLADYRLPAYSGRDALEYARQTYPHVPFIMATGAMGDEAAVELLKLGAKDYVLKDRLARLAPAIQRVLFEEIGVRNRILAEGKYKALFNAAMDGIVLIDCETWRIVDCNPEFQEQSGRTLEQLKELTLLEILPPVQRELARKSLLEIQQTENVRYSEVMIQKPDGKLVPVEFSAKLLDIQRQCFIQCLTRDISKRLRTEQALHESEERFRNIAASAQDAMLMMDHEGKISYWNAAAEKIFGYPAPEVTGQLLHELLAPERYLEQHHKGFSHFKKTGEGPVVGKTLELTGLKKDGTEFPLELSLSAIKQNGLFNAIGIVRDITGRKQAEKALMHANRALRTLSASNAALVRANDEPELLGAVCRTIVEQGGYRMAWVGYADDNPEQSITPRAWAGVEDADLTSLKLSWAETERGQGPMSRAIRSGEPQIMHDILSGRGFEPWRELAVARGFNSVFACALRVGNRIIGSLGIYAAEADSFVADEQTLLKELTNDLAFGIETLRIRTERDRLQGEQLRHAELLQKSLEQLIQAIADTVEVRDPYTAGHQRRASILAVAIARKMDLSEEKVHGIRLAATIHDLGKLQVPSEILAKPSKLSDIEFMLIKMHPQAGYDILKDVDFPWPIADIVRQHHERLDGLGYPQGLKGGEILLESRIIAVADVVEAMASHRPYRPALGIEAALAEIESGRGSAYDPAVVDACLKLFREGRFAF
jgi:PAS domain S-box-containing protein